MLNNKSQIKRRARRFFTQRACFSAVADCTSTISGASLFQSRVTTLPATLKTCSDLEDAAGIAKMTLKIGARMDHGLQKIIEKSVYCKVKIPNQNKTLTSALTYCLPRPAPPRSKKMLPRSSLTHTHTGTHVAEQAGKAESSDGMLTLAPSRCCAVLILAAGSAPPGDRLRGRIT